MKKLHYLLIVLPLLVVLGPAALVAGSEQLVCRWPLIAGGGNAASEIEVGRVNAWEDEFGLYVQYEILDPDWCITETHLHVADSIDGFPVNKKGIPKLGHFDYKGEHDCVMEVLYGPIGFDGGLEQLFIMAQAVVVDTSACLNGYCPEETAWGSWCHHPFPSDEYEKLIPRWAFYIIYDVGGESCALPE